MRTISSREMQKNFGSVADRVAAGESVRITRYGRPAFLLIPDTGDGEEILQELAARRLARMLRQTAPAGQSSQSDNPGQRMARAAPAMPGQGTESQRHPGPPGLPQPSCGRGNTWSASMPISSDCYRATASPG